MITLPLSSQDLEQYIGRRAVSTDVVTAGPANLLRLAFGRSEPELRPGFSALTFNSHRIHYDRAWAMDVEGYPGLVVHGPLTSTLLVDFARDHHPGRAFLTYTTQARAPLFDTAPFELRGRPSAGGGGAELWAVTPEGTVAMSAQVEFA